MKLFQYQKHKFNHLGLLVYKSGKSFVIVGGLFDNLIVSLVWESLSTKVPEELKMDPCNYDEAIQNKDTTLWQKAIKIEMESMYSKSSLISCEST